MINNTFPNWKDANTILKGLVDQCFGVKIEPGIANAKGTLVLSFMPDDEYVLRKYIPECEISTYLYQVSLFYEWVYTNLPIKSIYEKYYLEPLDRHTMNLVRNDIEKVIDKYDESGVKIKDIFLQCFLNVPDMELKYINVSMNLTT